jgi:hypothetical protein
MIVLALVVALAVAAGIAVYKHGSLAAAEASAKKEAAIVKADVLLAASKLEAFGSKVEADAKVELAIIVADLKKI